MLEKLAELILLPKIRAAEKRIGYKLVFSDIPKEYIQGIVSWDMSNTFKDAGLKIEVGMNYWTIGKIIHDVSSRFERKAVEYQSWLGGYLVKLAVEQHWTVEDHFKLAIADQNSWLHAYGDSKAMTSIKGWKFTEIGQIQNGQYIGKLYEGGCDTDSDMGNHDNNLKLKLESRVIAALFNLSNPKLHITGKEMRPKVTPKNYERLKLHVYIAIFDVEPKVKVVLYGNGTILKEHGKKIDTFKTLKEDLLKGMQACKIVKI